MPTSKLPGSLKRLTRWLLPALVSLGAAACGGGYSVEFGFVDDHHGHDRPDRPDHHDEAPRDPGLFLFAGDVCQCGGSLDGTGPGARFNGPEGIVADADGNLYVADRSGPTIRKITPQAVVTTLAGAADSAGSSDGVGASARFSSPSRLDSDRDGNLYVTDAGNSTIRRVSREGVVTTLAGRADTCGSADGTGTNATFCGPQGIVLDRRGNLYVTDTLNHTVRRIDTDGRVSTVAGAAGACGSSDGRGAAARFCQPQDITLDGAGNLYVADTANSTIRKITPAGDVTTIGGRANECASADGNADTSRFCGPNGITVDMTGDVYVADTGNATIRRISPRGTVSTIAGVPGRNGIVLGPLPGGLSGPLGLALTDTGTLAITSNNLVLKLVLPQ
ncbi:MAG: NHL repeat-containing protein [Massilia sp.]